MRRLIFLPLVLILCFLPACNLPRPTPTASSPTLAVSIPQSRPERVTPRATRDQPAPPVVTPAATPVPGAARLLEYDPALFSAYTAQSGDTLAVVAAHFGAAPGQIRSAQPLPERGLLTPGQVLVIPKPTEPLPAARFLLPDSEVVNSPCGRGFPIQEFITRAGGELSVHAEIVRSRQMTGAEIVRQVAEDTSLNPKVLLAFIETRSRWVLSRPASPNRSDPLGLNIPGTTGLYPELVAYAQLLNTGYYGWREGRLTELPFFDGGKARIAPELNAGSVGLQYLFARSLPQSRWENALYGPEGFLAVYQGLFGDPQSCAHLVEPLFPAGVQSPALELPFAPGEPWAFTGGLHEDWTTGTPQGSLDFAPITGEPPCSVSRAWALAAAAGVVTRSRDGQVQLALTDGAGALTGWELLYFHIAEWDRVPVGTRLQRDDRIGHPSCEGGVASGSHVHLARMYRGEWIGHGEAFPLVLSGWQVQAGDRPYQSRLVKGDRVVSSNIEGKQESWITR